MIAETPYSILVIKSPTILEQLSIQLHNGSSDTVNFGALHTVMPFSKVITDSSVDHKLIDWKDDLHTDDFIVSCMQSTMELISRPLSEDQPSEKNSFYR